MSTILLASRPADKIGEQGNQLESLACHFAKLGGCKLCGLRSQHLWQSLVGMLRGGNPWASEADEEENIVVIESKTDEKLHAV